MDDQLSVSPTVTAPTLSGTAIVFNRQAGGSPILAIRGALDTSLPALSTRTLRVGHQVKSGQYNTLLSLDTVRARVDGASIPTGLYASSSVGILLKHPVKDGITLAEFKADIDITISCLKATADKIATALYNREL